MTTVAQTLVDGPDPLGPLTATVSQVLDSVGPLRTAGLDVPTTDVASALAILLDVPLGNLAVKAWNQHRDVESARHSTAANPGTQEVIRLLEHRIESRQSPVIEATVNGVSKDLLAMDLLVEIEAASVDLVVRDGHVAEVRAGPAIARGTLSASEVVLASHEFQSAQLDVSPRILD